MKKILSFVLFFAFPSLLLADNSIPPTDLSKDYLSTIFGVVDGVLHGTGSEILGTMFGTFNSIILVFATGLLSYVLFTSILNTAHEGEFLGKKWSSVWIPLRIVTGVGLLLPKATGYSFVQILVMAAVIQGVDAADKVWNVALDYMNHNGTIIEPIQSIHSDDKKQDHSFLVSKAGSILKSEVCTLALQNALTKQYEGKSITVPNFMTLLSITGKGPNGENTGRPIDYTKDKGGFIIFPSGNLEGAFADLKGVCGSVSWDFINKNGRLNSNPTDIAANDSTSIAAQQFTLDVEPLAHSIANKLVPPTPAKEKVPSITLKANDPLFTNNSLIDSADDFFTIIKPSLRSLKEDSATKYKDFIKDAKGYGWILAGSYYYRMASLNQQLRLADVGALEQKITPTFSPNYVGRPLASMITLPNVLQNLKNNLPASDGVIDKYIADQTAHARTNNNPQDNNANPSPPSFNPADASGGLSGISKILNAIFPVTHKMQQQVFDAMNQQKLDPIFALTSVGNNLITSVEQVWIVTTSIFGGLGLAAVAGGAAAGFWTPAVGVNLMLLVIECFLLIMLPLGAWMGANFLLGSVLSYYIPMIPFLLFIFGSITWFAVVLEAILAAPLVALGITHPEGHDLMGKAEQAIMLLASVFLRPMLMIFGFIFGIILSYVGLSLFNKGYSIAVQFLNEFNGDLFGVIYQLAMMTIYTAAALAIVNRSFAMIHEVPNKVLRWIGGPQESGHEDAMMQGIRSQHDSDAGALSHRLQQSIPSDTQKLAAQARSGRGMREALDSSKKVARGTETPSKSTGDEGN